MSTSGQRWAAQQHDPADYTVVVERLRAMEQKMDESDVIDPHSPLGLEVLDILETAANKLQRV